MSYSEYDPAGHLEIELRLLSYIDGNLDPADAKQVEDHLLTCAACQELRERWEQLDLELMRMETPGLSEDFEKRLWLRISETPQASVEADRRQSVEAELRQIWAGIRQRFFRSQAMRLLDYAGFTAATALGGYLGYAVLLRVLAGSPAWAGSLQQWTPQLCTGAGIVTLFVCLALVARRRVIRWLDSL